LEPEEDSTTPADAALATGSELVALATGASLGDVVTPPPLGLLGVLPPVEDSDGSVTGVVEVEPELATLTVGVDALTLGVVTLTTGVVTVTLGTVTVTLGTSTDVSPRIGRLTLGSVTVGSVTLGSDRSISEAAPEVEEPTWLAPEDVPTRDDNSPPAWAPAQPSAKSAAQRQTSVTATATALRPKRAATIVKRLAQRVNWHSCACL
jgi:hypothetical protein